MKSVFGLIFFSVIAYSSSFAQIKSRALRIYSITEYIDGYVIKAVDSIKSDTLNIISQRDTLKSKRNFEKMVVGKRYNFEYEDLISQMAAVPPNTFVVRIKTTVVWKSGDGMSNIPVFAKNSKGLWIKK